MSQVVRGGLAVTAAVSLLLLPAQYNVLERTPLVEPSSALAWLERALDFSPLDLFVTVTLLLLGLLAYVCEWIQSKIMEKRIVELNQYISSSLARLCARDSQQEQLERTLKMVQNATSEYNLLLYLLLRQRGCAPPGCPPSSCFFDKDLDGPLFVTGASATLDS